LDSIQLPDFPPTNFDLNFDPVFEIYVIQAENIRSTIKININSFNPTFSENVFADEEKININSFNPTFSENGLTDEEKRILNSGHLFMAKSEWNRIPSTQPELVTFFETMGKVLPKEMLPTENVADFSGSYINGEIIIPLEKFIKTDPRHFLIAHASCILSFVYCKTTDKNIQDKAIKLLEYASDLGYLPAKFLLAKKYLENPAASLNLFLAESLFRQSSDAGYVPSKYYLGLCYSNGAGVEKNQDLAIKLFQESADAGYELGKVAIKKLSDPAKPPSVPPSVPPSGTAEVKQWVTKSWTAQSWSPQPMPILPSKKSNGLPKDLSKNPPVGLPKDLSKNQSISLPKDLSKNPPTASWKNNQTVPTILLKQISSPIPGMNLEEFVVRLVNNDKLLNQNLNLALERIDQFEKKLSISSVGSSKKSISDESVSKSDKKDVSDKLDSEPSLLKKRASDKPDSEPKRTKQ